VLCFIAEQRTSSNTVLCTTGTCPATVKAAKAFFQQVNELEKLVTKNPKKNDPAAVQRYLAALDILDTYLDLVELPPIDSGHYDQEFDTLVGETARIT
jgi:hypothetical protein